MDALVSPHERYHGIPNPSERRRSALLGQLRSILPASWSLLQQQSTQIPRFSSFQLPGQSQLSRIPSTQHFNQEPAHVDDLLPFCSSTAHAEAGQPGGSSSSWACIYPELYCDLLRCPVQNRSPVDAVHRSFVRKGGQVGNGLGVRRA